MTQLLLGHQHHRVDPANESELPDAELDGCFERAQRCMEPSIRRRVMAEGSGASPRAFLVRYCELHFERYGAPFLVTGPAHHKAILPRLAPIQSGGGNAAWSRLFFDHIDPVFTDLAFIHANYLEALEKLRACATVDGDLPAEIKKRSAGMEYVRNENRALAKAQAVRGLREYPQQATAFFVAVHDYFKVPRTRDDRPGREQTVTLFTACRQAEALKRGADPSARRATFLALIAAMADDKRARWDYLMTQYGEARAALVGGAD